MFCETPDFRLAPASAGNIIEAPQVRISLLTSALVRFEWSANGKFEDHQTLAVVNRDLGVVPYEKYERDGKLFIRTDQLEIELAPNGQKLDASNLQVKFFLNGQLQIWHPGMEDRGNLLGTCRTLDGCDGHVKHHRAFTPQETLEELSIGKGIISRDGWSVVDDSKNVLVVKLDSGRKWVAPREQCDRQDLYLFAYGHQYTAALHDAAEVFGSQPVPPRYALGYWYSRYWGYTDQEIEELIQGFDRADIPFDVMVIDMEWHLPGWTGYTWDRRYFPDPDEFLQHLHAKGLKVTLNLHPAEGVGKHEAQFRAMAQAMQLDPDKIDRVPFDITDPEYMKHYFEILHHPEERRGVDFWWMDWQQGESTTMPGLDTLPWINHLHWEDMQKRSDNKRPLIFSRFGGIGAGRYAIGFSGDTLVSWESLAYQPEFTARASNVLYGYWSHDIGGHMMGEVSPELYTRWVQFGIFSPIVRTHTTKNFKAERRFWAYPEPFSSYLRTAIQRRYELVPYIYSENYHALESGISLCHPLYYDYPETEEAYKYLTEYMFGRAMLVAPVVSPANVDTDLAQREIYLPEGDWFDVVQGAMVQGDQVLHADYLYNEIPVFVRPGTVVPGQKNCRRLNDRSYPNLVMTVYPGEAGRYNLYEDDGISNDYLQNQAVHIAMAHQNQGQEHHFSVRKTSGNFNGFLVQRELEVRLPGSIPPQKVLVNGREVPFVYRLNESSQPGWNYQAVVTTTVIQCGIIDLEQGVEIVAIYAQEDQYTVAAGLSGLFARLNQVALLTNTLVSAIGNLDNERLGQDLATTSRRIAQRPENFTCEVEALRQRLPDFLPAMRKLLGDSKMYTPDYRAKLAKKIEALLKSYV